MKVDVLTYNSLHPLLKERILNEQEEIFLCLNELYIEHVENK